MIEEAKILEKGRVTIPAEFRHLIDETCKGADCDIIARLKSLDLGKEESHFSLILQTAESFEKKLLGEGDYTRSLISEVIYKLPLKIDKQGRASGKITKLLFLEEPGPEKGNLLYFIKGSSPEVLLSIVREETFKILREAALST